LQNLPPNCSCQVGCTALALFAWNQRNSGTSAEICGRTAVWCTFFAKAISVQAVQKLVGALEFSLGLTLLERGARGVRLTAGGTQYLDHCRSLLSELEELNQAERVLMGSAERPSGALVVAAHPGLARHILLPALPRFNALYPDIELDLRTVNRIGDADATTADVLLLQGWPEVPADYVHRELGCTQTLIMAAPDYWRRTGVPKHPSDLTEHTCRLLRNPAGILLDLWEFKRNEETYQISVRGWMSSNSRPVILDLVMAGHGVGRFTELTTRPYVQAGQLVPVFLDWDVQGGPPINLIYRGSARRTPRMRAFIDFTLQCLNEMNGKADSSFSNEVTKLPAWHRRGYGRASATVRGRG
jgi:DNA-binding transcriptional LysR family regulator